MRKEGKLTERQCRSLIGGVIGCLANMADIRDVRAAVEWWFKSEASWGILEMMSRTGGAVDKMAEEAIKAARTAWSKEGE